jgi:hypothetical protein
MQLRSPITWNYSPGIGTSQEIRNKENTKLLIDAEQQEFEKKNWREKEKRQKREEETKEVGREGRRRQLVDQNIIHQKLLTTIKNYA